MLGLPSMRFAVLVFLAGCFGTAPHVPFDASGTVPLTIVNTTDRDIWAYAMWPDGPTPANPVNWLGEGDKAELIKLGGQRTFLVKPGRYRNLIMFTDVYGYHNNRYVSGSLGKEHPRPSLSLHVDGPTRLVVGPRPAPPDPGVRSFTYPMVDTYGR